MTGIIRMIQAIVLNLIAALIDARYLLIDLNQNHGSSRSLNAAGYRKLNSGECFWLISYYCLCIIFRLLYKKIFNYPNYDSLL